MDVKTEAAIVDDVEAVVRQVEYIDADAEMPRYLPTQEEIREACLLIQAGWPPDEERRRRVVQPSREVWYGGVVTIGE